MRETRDRYRVSGCAALLLALLLARTAQAQGSIAGLVTDQSGGPIHDAEVVIDRIRLFTRTDSTGRFHFRSVPPGFHRVAVRRLGYAPASVEIRLADHDNTSVLVKLSQLAQPLPAVPVEGSPRARLDRRFADFERRRSSGVGQFLTADDLAPERSKPLGDVLVRLRGVYIVRSATAACLTSTRGTQSFQNAATGYCGDRSVESGYCPVAVFVDGHPAYSGHSEEIFNLNSFRADEVAGIEFYSGSGTMPRELSAPGGTCGALVVWSKR